MSFFRLVRREMQGSLPRLAFMSALGGISNAAILAAINVGAQNAQNGTADLWSAALFIVSLILFIKAQHYLLIVTTAESEAIIHRLRVRLLDEVRRSELLGLEGIGRPEIVVAITKDTATLTQAANMLAFGAQGIVLIFFVALYVAYLSPVAFVLSVLIVGLVGILFHSKRRQIAEEMNEAARWESRLYERMMDLLDGFKEVRLNKARSDDLISDIRKVSRHATNIKIRANAENSKRMVFTQSAMYMLLGMIVFVVPVLTGETDNSAIMKNTTALLFVVGTCFGLMQTVSMLTAANAAADRIERLEALLRATVVTSPAHGVEPRRTFEKLELYNVLFRYPDRPSEAGFQIGPVDFTLRSGELVFITGGNGSGKSTFMKVLSGLYAPDSGSIAVDGFNSDASTYPVHRDLITAIFSDYHLFHYLYGIPDPDPAEVDRLLTQFALRDKTHLKDCEFDTLDLSAGQRKRLALLVGLLEKRPILLLDEWTANQDPDFRRKFYVELLPVLLKSGLTVVVVTHDDRYVEELDLPARRFRMDEGRFV
jgi:putative pyoverdin transport system ATP-binding/permease protein